MKSVQHASAPERFAARPVQVCTGAIISVVLVVLLLHPLCVTSSWAQQGTGPDSGVRGIFLDSRPSDSQGKTAKPNARSSRLGFGYTLFLEQNGQKKRVSPGHVFHSGDRVHLLVEANRSAYLYVFHQDEKGPAQLLFPDARLRHGDNAIAAHQLTFIPYEGSFVFDNQSGDEKLTLVVAEKPLANVPRGAELSDSGSFQMSPDSLAHLVETSLPAQKDAEADDGQPMSPSEGKRGVTLSMNDPPPSHVLMNNTTQSGWITAQLVLVHR